MQIKLSAFEEPLDECRDTHTRTLSSAMTDTTALDAYASRGGCKITINRRELISFLLTLFF